MSPDCTDTGINEGADAFSLQSTIAPERRVVVYVINKLPRVVLSRKLREDDSTRHDARFAGFEMTERMVALNVIAMWLRGMPRTQLKKYMIKNEKYLPELDLFILPRGFVGYMRK